MPLDSRRISQRVINRLDDIGIMSRVGGNESETAQLVRLIINEIISAIHTDALVTGEVLTAGSPTVHKGNIVPGTGRIT